MSPRAPYPNPTAAITDDPGSMQAWTEGLERGAQVAARNTAEGYPARLLMVYAREHEEAAREMREQYARTLGLAVGLVLAGTLNQTEAATLAGVDRMTIRRFLGARTQHEQHSTARRAARAAMQ